MASAFECNTGDPECAMHSGPLAARSLPCDARAQGDCVLAASGHAHEPGPGAVASLRLDAVVHSNSIPPPGNQSVLHTTASTVAEPLSDPAQGLSCESLLGGLPKHGIDVDHHSKEASGIDTHDQVRHNYVTEDSSANTEEEKRGSTDPVHLPRTGIASAPPAAWDSVRPSPHLSALAPSAAAQLAFSRPFRVLPYTDARHLQVCTAADGRLIACHVLRREVLQLCSVGRARIIFAFAQPTTPRCVASMHACHINSSPDIIVTTMQPDQVVRLTLDGHVVWRAGSLGAGPTCLNQPGAVCVLPSGDIAVADSRNHRLQLLSPRGDFLRSVTPLSPRSASPCMRYPLALALDPHGRLFVGASLQIFLVNVECDSFTIVYEHPPMKGGPDAILSLAVCGTLPRAAAKSDDTRRGSGVAEGKDRLDACGASGETQMVVVATLGPGRPGQFVLAYHYDRATVVVIDERVDPCVARPGHQLTCHAVCDTVSLANFCPIGRRAQVWSDSEHVFVSGEGMLFYYNLNARV